MFSPYETRQVGSIGGRAQVTAGEAPRVFVTYLVQGICSTYLVCSTDIYTWSNSSSSVVVVDSVKVN